MKDIGCHRTSSFYRRGGKRALDLILGVAGFLLLLPLLFAIAIVVWKDVGRPIFYRQSRPGLRGKPFRIFKFRTMKELRGPEGNRLSDAMRVTTVGRLLRSSSLDELPELLNVLRGEMSLVGPRPLLMEYLDRYTPAQARRHEVMPGITGWAQVNGRNAITWEEKFALDVWYVDNRTFRLDLKIIAMTVAKVVRGEGISAPGEATMPEFMGTAGAGKEKECQ